jgi:hypothetical protein
LQATRSMRKTRFDAPVQKCWKIFLRHASEPANPLRINDSIESLLARPLKKK